MYQIQEVLDPQMRVFLKRKSTGFTVGLLEDKALTDLQSWKGNENEELQQQRSEDYRVLPIKGLHLPGLLLFAQGGDAGSAVMTQSGAFVGLYFAGNDYTGTGYVTCAADLFSDIKRVTSAKEIELLEFAESHA